jgi:hypothetical protein
MNLFSKAILSAAIIGIALTGCGEKKDNHLKVGAIAGAETQVAKKPLKSPKKNLVWKWKSSSSVISQHQT